MKDHHNSRQYYLSFRKKYIGKYLFIRKIANDIYEFFIGDENTVVPENVKKYKISYLKSRIKKGKIYIEKVKGMSFFYNKKEYEYAVVNYLERRIYFFTNLKDAVIYILSKFTNPDLIDIDTFVKVLESYFKYSSKTKPNIKKFAIVFVSFSELFGIVYDIDKFVKYFFNGDMKKFRNFLSAVHSKYINVIKKALERLKNAEVPSS